MAPSFLLLISFLSVGYEARLTKDCFWNGTALSMEENCTRIVTENIVISNDHAEILYKKLAWVEEIIGCLKVVGSSYDRLDFLARLKTITCNAVGYDADIIISNNSALTRLGMPVLKVNRFYLENNPSLCFTPEEKQRHSNLEVSGEPIATCQGRNGTIRECYSTDSQLLEDNCEIVLGSLFIQGQFNQSKLQYVTEVNGHIYIRDTSYSNISFPSLKKVYAADSTSGDPAVFSIIDVSNLTYIDLPSLSFVSRSELTLYGEPPYSADQTTCNKLAKYGQVSSSGKLCVPNEESLIRLSWLLCTVAFLVFQL